MDFDDREYSQAELRQLLMEDPASLFASYKKRRWLKIYSLLVSEDWKQNLFDKSEIVKCGEIFRVNPISKTSDEQESYILEEYCPGLLLMYTYASNENYQKDLGKRVDRHLGATRMWVKPDLFEVFWKGLLEDTRGYVYLFSSRRSSSKDGECKYRPRYNRRIEYRGNDASIAIDEMKELYGVLPDRVYLKAAHDLKIHMTNDGLFAAQRYPPELFDLYFKYLDATKEEALSLKRTAMRFNYEIKERYNVKVASISAGKIRLSDSKPVVTESLERLQKSMAKYSLIDACITQGNKSEDTLKQQGNSLTATVIDELKGSVFDINMDSSRIIIVPKYKPTFESFIGFYRGIVESYDEAAELDMLESG